MSISGLVGLSPSHTSATQNYDHAITLVDKTKVGNEPETPVEDAAGSASSSRTGSGTPLNRKWTKGTLREELARRKYSKWQDDSVKGQEDKPKESGNASESSDGEPGKVQAKRISKHISRNPFRSRKHSVKPLENDTFIEVLYENQRGAFFCGIPLYSGNSLLNFDPSPWQTSTFRDSPVNITDAQVPDPSWAWTWRTWYVDMSYDVDEEGWQYSFSFSHGYAWHGTHPWFHSFVRRRRWLRKRVRIHSLKSSTNPGNIKDAHLLNADYFTIHASRERDRSRGSSADRTATYRTSMIESFLSESEGEDDIGDVSDILKLITILRKARIDREKISAVRAFIDQAGDDLVYLGDKMAEIMSLLIYHTSRLQLQSDLHQSLEDAKNQHEGKPTAGEVDDKDKESLAKRISNLTKAVRATDDHVEDDHGPVRGRHLKDEDDNVGVSNPERDESRSSKEEAGKEGTVIEEDRISEAITEELKGIPDEAEISEDQSIQWGSGREDQRSTTPTAQEKGKGKERQ